VVENRLQKVAIVLKPATILRFHKALVKRKYSKLYSNKTKKKPGRKPQDQKLIEVIVMALLIAGCLMKSFLKKVFQNV